MWVILLPLRVSNIIILLFFSVAEQSSSATEIVASSDARVEDEQSVADIGQVYHINPDDILGSGQFGIVFGGEYYATA